MTEQTWPSYRDELFGEPYMVWHDGADFTLLHERWRSEPLVVEAMLLRGLGEGDALAAQAIGDLDFAVLTAEQRAAFAAALTTQLASAFGEQRVTIGVALFRLTGDPAWSVPVVEVLAGPDDWTIRIDAAIALRVFPASAHLIDVAARGVLEADYLVRYHCAETLLRWAAADHELPADPVFGAVADDAQAGWADAAAQLAQAARARLGS